MFEIQDNKYQHRKYEYACRKCKKVYSKYPNEVIDTFNGDTFICNGCILDNPIINNKIIDPYKCNVCGISKEKYKLLLIDKELTLCKTCLREYSLTQIIDKLNIDNKKYYYFAEKIKLSEKYIVGLKVKCKCCNEDRLIQNISKDFICGKCKLMKKKLYKYGNYRNNTCDIKLWSNSN